MKLPNQRGSKKTGDGAERDRARRAARDTRPEQRKVEKLRVRDRARRATQTASERQATFNTAEKYAKEGKLNLRGERNEVRANERQTGSGKLRGERLKIITADKDQPARKVSS